MDQSPAPEATLSSLPKAGGKPGTWEGDRSYSAQKPCAHCGKIWGPRRLSKKGVIFCLPESSWNAQECCGQSCAKKRKNPMGNREARLKMAATLRRIKHRPIKLGGNGRLLPLSQLALLHALGEGWESEYVVKTGHNRFDGSGFPTNYKIDIANPEKMVGIEIDGTGHNCPHERERDAKKTTFLVGLGWSIYRVTNERALHLFSTFESKDILLTSLGVS